MNDPDTFAGPGLPPQFRWHCEPHSWSAADGHLRLQTEAPTDFWQRTHYGFRADNGHFLCCEVADEFVLTARVLFHPAHQYDQAGVMVRVSSDCWLKSAVEFEPSGPNRLGVVVTNRGYSDWSSQDFPPDVSEVWLRLRRETDDYLVESSCDGKEWSQLRIAHLHDGGDGPVACGIYACSPKAGGFACEFDEFSVTAGRLLETVAQSSNSSTDIKELQ